MFSRNLIPPETPVLKLAAMTPWGSLDLLMRSREKLVQSFFSESLIYLAKLVFEIFDVLYIGWNWVAWWCSQRSWVRTSGQSKDRIYYCRSTSCSKLPIDVYVSVINNTYPHMSVFKCIFHSFVAQNAICRQWDQVGFNLKFYIYRIFYNMKVIKWILEEGESTTSRTDRCSWNIVVGVHL